MASLEQASKGGKQGEVRYLTPLDIETSKEKKYCRFKKSGIKYIDYKDPDFLLKFVNEQGKILPRTHGYFPKIPAQTIGCDQTLTAFGIDALCC